MEEGEGQPVALHATGVAWSQIHQGPGGHSPWRNQKTSFKADSEGGDTVGGLRSQRPQVTASETHWPYLNG